MTQKKHSKNKKQVAKAKKNGSGANGSRKHLFLALAIGLLGFLLYSNTLGHQYCYDDFGVVKDNYVVKKGVEGISTIWKTNYRYGYWQSSGTLYRPLTLSLFALEWQLAPDNTGFAHFVNNLLYGLSCGLLYVVLFRLFRKHNWTLAALASLLFTTHPIHTEVVANIKSADEILGLLFGLLAILSLIKWMDKDRVQALIMSLFWYTLALFSKESVLTFLAVFPLTVYWFWPDKWKRKIALTGLYVLPFILYWSTQSAVLGGMTAGTEAASVLDNLLNAQGSWMEQKATALLLAGQYLKTLVLPYPLVSDMGYPQILLQSITNPLVIASALALLGILVLGIKGIAKRNVLGYASLFFLITFSIFSNLFVQIGSSYGERFLYIPSIGFCLGLVWYLGYLSGWDWKKNASVTWSGIKGPAAYVVIAISIVYALLTFQRNPDWYDSYTLYHTDVATSPKSAKLRYHHGLETMKNGVKMKDPVAQQKAYRTAIEEFNTAIRLYPNYGDAYGELGLAYYRLKNYEQALPNYLKAVEMEPRNALVHSNLGTLYANMGQTDKALESYKEAVKYDPRFVDARRNLGSIYANKKMFKEAAEQFEQALIYKPEDPTVNFYLGRVLTDMGDPRGQQYLQKAKRLNPNLN